MIWRNKNGRSMHRGSLEVPCTFFLSSFEAFFWGLSFKTHHYFRSSNGQPNLMIKNLKGCIKFKQFLKQHTIRILVSTAVNSGYNILCWLAMHITIREPLWFYAITPNVTDREEPTCQHVSRWILIQRKVIWPQELMSTKEIRFQSIKSFLS